MTPTTTPTTRIGLKHLDHLNMTVTDLTETVEWYRRILDFEQVEEGIYEGQPWAIIRSGDAMLCLYERPGYTLPEKAARAAAQGHGLNHLALRITDAGAWAARVQSEGLPLHFGGVTHWPNSTAWYIQDPTGYSIEVVAWKGDSVQF
jgi:lactoylglutathione lyase